MNFTKKAMFFKTIIISILLLTGCASMPDYNKTVSEIDMPKFMGQWYVMAGRFTPFEKEVHNGIETYVWNESKKRIDIDFQYRRGGFEGPLKKITQKGWIHNETTKSHWKVSPLWPLKFDYLVIDLAPDYSWTVIGVPDQAFLWIMVRDYNMPKEKIDQIIQSVAQKGYDTSKITFVPHKY